MLLMELHLITVLEYYISDQFLHTEADTNFTLVLNGPYDDSFHANDSKIAMALYSFQTSCADSSTITTDGFNIDPSTLSTTVAIPSECADPAYIDQSTCEAQEKYGLQDLDVAKHILR